MARVRSELATPLIRPDAESVNTFTGPERQCSFGVVIQLNRESQNAAVQRNRNRSNLL